jgi:hypothetical protein
MQILLPAFTSNSPRAIDVQYLKDGPNALWLTDGLTPEMRKVGHFLLAPRDLIPWTPSRLHVFTTAAPQLPLAPPELTVLRDDRQHGRDVSVRIRSVRNAPRVTLIFNAPDLAYVRVNGVRPPPQRAKFRSGFADGWHWVSVRGMQDAEIEIVLTGNHDIEAFLSDTSFELPAEAVPLTRARDASIAVPTHNGDSVVVRRRIKL